MKGIKVKDKHILIPWSGGLDSTYSVLYYLKEGYIVHAPYITIVNNEDKVKQELLTIDRFKEMEPFKYYIENDKLKISIASKFEIMNTKDKSITMSQPIIWLTGLLFTLKNNITYEKVILSYVMNDCAVSYVNEIRDIWKSLEVFLGGGTIPPIRFPWIKWGKESFITGYEEFFGPYYKKILDNVWWCESPRDSGDICTTCVPCKRYSNINYFDYKYKNDDCDRKEVDIMVNTPIESVKTTIIVKRDKPKSKSVLRNTRRRNNVY